MVHKNQCKPPSSSGRFHCEVSYKGSLSDALRVLESFGKVLGLRLNSKKTEALWIGACAGKREKLCPEKDFNWLDTKVKVLGVWLSTDPEITTKFNFFEKNRKNEELLSLLV